MVLPPPSPKPRFGLSPISCLVRWLVIHSPTDDWDPYKGVPICWLGITNVATIRVACCRNLFPWVSPTAIHIIPLRGTATLFWRRSASEVHDSFNESVFHYTGAWFRTYIERDISCAIAFGCACPVGWRQAATSVGGKGVSHMGMRLHSPATGYSI